MINELLFIISILLTFSNVVFLYKYFGKSGLFCWISLASVLANIIVIKTVDCFGLTTTLGNVLFGSVFLCCDILTEHCGKKEANKAILMGLISNIAFVVVSQIVILYKPSISDFASEGFNTIFKITPRVCLGSICSYAFGNFLDVFIFDKLKAKHGSKLLWLRNSVSTIVAQLFDNFVLHIIAFLGIMTMKEVVKLSFSVWAIEVIIAILDTPFIYYSKKINSEQKSN